MNADELVFLGSGGGRHNIRTQRRATGGILYKFNGVQAHIDPGPGAIVRLNQYGEDPTKTELFIVSHTHIDHYNDISVVIEASRENFYDSNRNFLKKGTLICPNETLNLISKYHQNMVEKIVNFCENSKFMYKGVKIEGTKTIHGKVAGFGLKFKLKDYSIAYSSDSIVFDGFSEQFSGVNILILNLLRPDSIVCKEHMCTDEAIPALNKIEPPLDGLIITHFGSYMDGWRTETSVIPNQLKKLKEKTKIKHIFSADDGLKVQVKELLT